MTRRLTASELRQLEAAGPAARRAARELRDRRAVEQLTPPQVAALESIRALVEEEGGDRRAELEVLDLLLVANGKPPAPADHEESEELREPQGPRRDVKRWPFL